MQAGDIFDKRYRLIRKLGSGGFSEVWLAEDLQAVSLKVALKIYSSTRANPNEVEAFIEKFRLVYDVNHTNLLPPNACGEYNGMLYLVLRYCERGSSYSLLGNISEKEAWYFLHDVASGLEYLHQRNIIHQDIKPDNVLITTDDWYVITDFDISAKARNTLRMGSTAPVGTSAYMSPERFGSTPAPVKASDIWALGASLYELISGNLPFGDLGGLNQKNGANYQPLKNTVSKDLRDIITLCLQKETWNRPTAEEIRVWCDLHFKGKRIHFERKYREILDSSFPPGGFDFIKLILWIFGIAAIAAIVLISKPYIDDFLKKKEHFDYYKTKAKNFYDSKDYPAALNYCDSALFIFENDTEMIGLKKDIETIIKKKEHFDYYKTKAKNFYDLKDFPVASNYCDSALSIIPTDTKMTELKKNINSELTKLFEKYKSGAIQMNNIAQQMNDPDYYPLALKYCDSALFIFQNNMEMKELKKNIETKIKESK